MCLIGAGAGGGNADEKRVLGAGPVALDLLDPRAVRPGGARRRARRARRVGGPVKIETGPMDVTTPPRKHERDVAMQ
jgi:hypothetical protein